MSDACMYELEDIVSDDMYQCDDHVVPCSEHDSFQCNSDKRLRQGTRNMECDVGDLPFVRQVSAVKAEQANLNGIHQRSSMLEKEIWPKKSFSTLPSCNSESINEASSLGSEADNDFSFIRNNEEEKQSNDLLHYSWADIGNFDDVYRMFRSYDSTFGQGTSHEDNLGLFSLSNATERSEDTLKLDSNFSCPDSCSLRSIPENDDVSRFNGMCVEGESGHFGAPSSNGSDCSGDKSANNNIMHNAHIYERNTESKHQNQSDISDTDQYLENSPIFYVENVSESGQQAEDLDSQFFDYLQDDYMSSNYNCQQDRTVLHPPHSITKLEYSSPTSFSLKDSYSLNQTQSTAGSKESSLLVIPFASEKRLHIHQQRGFQASESVNPENVDSTIQGSTCDTTTEKAVPYSSESHIDGEVNVGISFDLGSSAQYSSMGSGLDDISLEATSFRQLQNAMERLDLRTKLCIRDSLYRLAQSAEQRNHYVNMKDVSIDDKDSMCSDQTNKFTSFMDIETETNPIDRSIAHLLFHRPADSSGMAGHDSSLNSPAPMHGSSSNSPVVADGSIKREETAAKSYRNVAEN